MLIYNILLIAQIIVALAIIGLVLIQHGKGADAGAAFGGGSSGTVFGSRGSSNFLSRSTGVLAAVFFANSLALAWLVAHRGNSDIFASEKSVVPQEATGQVKPAPVVVPTVPSDVPANVGSTENTKPTADGNKTPTDIPAAVEPPTSNEEKPSDAPTPAQAPVTTEKSQIVAPTTNIPEKIETPKAPVKVPAVEAPKTGNNTPSDVPAPVIDVPTTTNSTETAPADVPQ
jgi:preprotein translocase subunit SecG